MTDIFKLIPDGASVVGVIIVVILFLRHQKEFNVTLQNIATDFREQIAHTQEQYQAQVKQLAEQFQAAERAHMEQIKALIDDYISISRETVGAVKELEEAVRELKDKIKV